MRICTVKLVNATELVWGNTTFRVLGIEFDTDLEQKATTKDNS